MLGMAALQLGHPVPFLILLEADDAPIHYAGHVPRKFGSASVYQGSGSMQGALILATLALRPAPMKWK